MPSRRGPSAMTIVVGAVGVVIVVAVVGGIWGAKAFVAACLVASVFAGFVVTRGG